jgi:chromosome segregation ATPase
MQQFAVLSSLCKRLQSELDKTTQQLHASQARVAILAKDLHEAHQLLQAYASTIHQQKVQLVRLAQERQKPEC